MEIKLKKTPKMFFYPEALESVYRVAKYANEDVWVVGKLFYVDNEAYCESVDILKQSVNYSNSKIDADFYNKSIEKIEKDDNTAWFNILIYCKSKSAAAVYSIQEEEVEKILKPNYDFGWLMVVNDKREIQLNYYDWEREYTITDMPVLVDTSGYSDISETDIKNMVKSNVKKTYGSSSYGNYYDTGSSQGSWWKDYDRKYSKTSKVVERVPSKLAKEKPALSKLV